MLNFKCSCKLKFNGPDARLPSVGLGRFKGSSAQYSNWEPSIWILENTRSECSRCLSKRPKSTACRQPKKLERLAPATSSQPRYLRPFPSPASIGSSFALGMTLQSDDTSLTSTSLQNFLAMASLRSLVRFPY